MRSNFYNFQSDILKMNANRFEIPRADYNGVVETKIFIIRNEALEPYLTHSINCSSLIGVNLKIEYSNYDDTVATFQIPANSEFVVVWINWDRIPQTSFDLIFSNDLGLRGLINDGRVFFVVPNAASNFDRQELISRLDQIKWPHDRRICTLNQPNISETKKRLGYTRYELDFISSFIGLKIASQTKDLRTRAIIIDLDNTLYRGVFGEDSQNELKIQNDYISLQKKLLTLKEQGVLLCIASKNNREDISSILKSNLVPILSEDDFTIIKGGWGSKIDSIKEILQELNFDERFAVFIDDNHRELIEVESEFKNLMCISGLDPISAYNSLDICVSFESSQDRVTMKQRLDDIRGNSLRSKIFDTKQDSEHLHVKLGTQIYSRLATKESEFVRANELFRKTNQFNVTLARSIINSSDLMNSPNVAICEMRDSISDSGIIASILFNFNSNDIEIQEFVISCRALGRDVEKYIFRSLLESVTETFWQQNITLIPNFGPKNVPAIEFVNNYFGVENGRNFLLSDKLVNDTGKHFVQINRLGES